MFFSLIKKGRKTQKLCCSLEMSSGALRRQVQKGSLCGARGQILVVLF